MDAAVKEIAHARMYSVRLAKELGSVCAAVLAQAMYRLRDTSDERLIEETGLSAEELAIAKRYLSAPQPRKRTAVSEPAGFDEFWAEYPRKVNKPGALRAWRALSPDEATRSAMMTALRRHKQSEQWRKDGGIYIPHPSTWINGRRWEDSLVQPSRAQWRGIPVAR